MSDSLPVCLQLISSSSALSASCSALPCLALYSCPFLLQFHPRYSRTLYPSHPCSAIPTLNNWRISMPPLPASCLAEAYQVCATYSRCTIANRSLLISPNDRTHAERWWNSLIPTNEGGQILRNPRGIARRLKQVASIGTLLVAVSE
jgi:hypothetical protein